MDIGNFVVDLVSLVIVMSVFTVVVLRADASSPDNDRALTEDADDYGFFGPNPLEDDGDTHGGRLRTALAETAV